MPPGSSHSEAADSSQNLPPGSSSLPRGYTSPLGYLARLEQLQDRYLLRGPALSQWLWDNRTPLTAGTASLISTAISFPLDSLKARLQVRNYPRPAVWNCAHAVFREEGIRGFTRGMAIPLVTISFVRTSSFSIYTYTKQALHRAGIVRDKEKLSHVALSGAGGGATSGMIISCGSAPFELVKVQRQLEYIIAMQQAEAARAHGPVGAEAAAVSGTARAKYTPMSGFQAARFIYQQHRGIRGFYLGFRLHLMRDTLGTTLYFCLYDSSRALIARKAAKQQGLSPHDVAAGPVGLWGIPAPVVSFLNGSAAGIASWLVVYPLDLVKTRVQKTALGQGQTSGNQQAHRKSPSVLRTFLTILNAPTTPGDALGTTPGTSTLAQPSLPNRFLRLYRGLGVSALRSFISHGVTWSLIEYTALAISRRAQRDGIPGSGETITAARRQMHARPDSTVLE